MVLIKVLYQTCTRFLSGIEQEIFFSQDGLPVSVLMMIKIVRYHDPERLCVPNTTTDCWVVFTMCFGR